MNDASKVPVLVGVAQLEQRISEPGEGEEPLALMVEAVKRAAEDAGSQALLAAATSVRVVRGAWSYDNPAKAVAEQVGLGDVETGLTPFGGNGVQSVFNRSALEVQAGRHEVIVITGAECGNSQAKARKAGVELELSEAPGKPSLFIGEDNPMSLAFERERGVRAPIQFFPMFENALRHHRGESIEAHLERISELWASFNQVAVDNPHAWIREPLTAEAIRTPSASNRPISFPYPKLMNSNRSVDQGAALILCSLEAARRCGVPEDKIVYAWAGTDAHDAYVASHRDNFYSSPGIRTAGRRVLELAGIEASELVCQDVYSCFPVAVQVAAEEIGLRRDIPLTVTGGLMFGGGPLNNYVMHSIATTAEILRRHPGRKGLVTAMGGYLAKHAFGVYSTEPPPQPYRHQDVQDEVDGFPTRELDTAFSGEATVESYTVMYGPDGPTMALLSALTPEGKRTWANSHDIDMMKAMTQEEFCGKQTHVSADGVASF
ncbi:MAG: acetyl-CoA acetyltransferase [Pseudomonadales bacterium]